MYTYQKNQQQSNSVRSKDNSFNNEEVSKVKSIQMKPKGTYANGIPAATGLFSDTHEQSTSVVHNGRPTRVIGVMKQPIGGGVPSVNPPGWAWLKNNFGKLKGQWVRFHIINQHLGGPGNNIGNLVPTTHNVNHAPAWRNVEEKAKKSANTDKNWTFLDVNITYDDNYPTGIPAKIKAAWGEWDNLNGVWSADKNPTGDITQPDPTANAVPFLTGAQITQSILKDNLGVPNSQAPTVQAILQATYNSQSDFEAELVKYEKNYMGDDSIFEWFPNQAYVDEEDDKVNFPPPYRVVLYP